LDCSESCATAPFPELDDRSQVGVATVLSVYSRSAEQKSNGTKVLSLILFRNLNPNKSIR